ncbi:general stress protein [Nonomuraea salmonea]|uniref:general stress protein n=1 Tax=Nonomuraea salmonea TaxID=46181 RepID=UPI003610C99E
MTKRELIGSYSSYEEAQKVVDHLSDHGFPVSGTLIVGSGLHSMERVLARMTHLRAAGWGAAGGAWFGVLIGLFLAIFSTTAAAGLPLVLWAAVGCGGWSDFRRDLARDVARSAGLHLRERPRRRQVRRPRRLRARGPGP